MYIYDTITETFVEFYYRDLNKATDWHLICDVIRIDLLY